MKNWKTTAVGILGFLSTSFGTLSAWLAIQSALHSSSYALAEWSAGTMLATGLVKSWIAYFQVDGK